MAKLIMILVTLGLVSCVTEPTFEYEEEFLWTCEAMAMDCSDVERPTVLESRHPLYFNYIGMTMANEPIILIAPRDHNLWVLVDATWEEVLVHELAHYLQDVLDMNQADRREHEKYAQEIEQRYRDANS